MHTLLADVRELAEGKCKIYALTVDNKPLELFILHHGGRYYAYENHCPHTGVNLNWQADQFLDITEQRIQCATHGALFRIEDGLCEWGPCLGKRLRPLAIEERDGKLVLLTASTKTLST